MSLPSRQNTNSFLGTKIRPMNLLTGEADEDVLQYRKIINTSVLNIGFLTDRSGQTAPDQGPHCLSFRLHVLDASFYVLFNIVNCKENIVKMLTKIVNK